MLDPLFYPKTICLVGNTEITSNISTPEIFENIQNNLSYFHGKTTTVDLKKEQNFPKADLYIILLNESELLKHIDYFNCKFCIILPGGYSQKKVLLTKMKEKSIRFLGPNSVCGIINTDNSLNTTFEKAIVPNKGSLSIISQSGGVGAAVYDIAIQKSSIGGVAKLVWLGNAWDIDISDTIQYLHDDKQTKAMGLYIEGIENGSKFINIVKRIRKPLTALKGGDYQQTAKRALTHTSSMAGQSKVYSSAFKQLGIFEANSIEELYYTTYFLSLKKEVNGKKIAIVSNVGGPSILAADAVLDNGLELSEFEDKTVEKIKRKYPMISAINPLDIIADADGERFEHCLSHVVNDKNVDAVIVINMLKSCTLRLDDIKAISKIIRSSNKLVVDVTPGIGDWKKVRSVMRDDDIYVFNNFHQATEVIKSVYQYFIYRNKK